MRCFRWLLPVALLTVALPAPRVQADPITYLFSGIFSGSLNGTDFTAAPFELSLATDTDGVFQPIPSRPNLFNTQNATLNFVINGVNGTFSDPFHVFLNRFGRNSSVGLSPDSGDDLVDITDLSLATYDLKSAFGPLTQSPPDFLNPGEAYATSAGDLILLNDASDSVTFQARLGTAAVPEPGVVALLAGSVGASSLLLLRRRRSNQAGAGRMSG